LAFAQFRNNGLLGCGACYAAFEGLLSPMLARAHEGGTHHVGRKPRSAIEPAPDPKAASGAGVAQRTVPKEQHAAPGTSDSAPAPNSPAQATPGVHATPSSAAKPTKSPRDGASHGEKKSGSGSGAARGKSASGAHDPAKVEAALRQQLKDAIEAEQYEQAASLRDELAKLTGRATGPRADTGSGGHAGRDAGRSGEDHK
jgi:protein-arginine kinase activator protein McsA